MNTDKQLFLIRKELRRKFNCTAEKFREMDQVKKRSLYLNIQTEYFVALTRIEELVNRALNTEYAIR
jgi:hypothetical protein